MIRDDTVYLAHILDAVRQIQLYTQGMDYEGFSGTRMVQDAVIRQFEIIGEAAKNMSAEFRSLHGHVPWKDLAGFRDKLIHQYFGVDLATVWRSVEDDIPILLADLIKLQIP
ncbi:DUF86 domain-containing protein [Geomonas paludis]|uniref:DUF86 domain-containing protein n=1 Tax=Geomonas paludis TaxID=2740185 RepID=A0A6V8N1W1_9BACT|nr:DUF86 domain-containing protein [Geomonas paludis]UPU36301.1 DUF86 domain-containing protein [Geomonas paludis]GFO66401.1 DUF86 domain-containing protein [Geomonas paludis]